jgi:uncharacterized protein YciI
MPQNSQALPRTADVPSNLKPYFLCLLRKGPQWDVPEKDLMPLHLAFFRRQIEVGNMVLAGPVLDEAADLRGICILRAKNRKAAEAAASDDPAVKAGRLVAEIWPMFLPSLDGVRVEYQ